MLSVNFNKHELFSLLRILAEAEKLDLEKEDNQARNWIADRIEKTLREAGYLSPLSIRR
jgi:hypothetical protein